MAQPTPGKRRFQHLYIAAVLFALAMASAAQAAVDLGGGSVAAAGGGKTVPCSQLPELQHMAMRVAILGRCRWVPTSHLELSVHSRPRGTW
jgi:hypothetical protein